MIADPAQGRIVYLDFKGWTVFRWAIISMMLSLAFCDIARSGSAAIHRFLGGGNGKVASTINADASDDLVNLVDDPRHDDWRVVALDLLKKLGEAAGS